MTFKYSQHSYKYYITNNLLVETPFLEIHMIILFNDPYTSQELETISHHCWFIFLLASSSQVVSSLCNVFKKCVVMILYNLLKLIGTKLIIVKLKYAYLHFSLVILKIQQHK